MGLPGSGKTTLAKELAKEFSAVHWNADEVRAIVGKHLDFSMEARIEQAKRMRFLCEVVAKTGVHVIADFVCPTIETRSAFGDAYVIWVNRINKEDSRFEDTRALFAPPEKYDFHYAKEHNPHDVIVHIKSTPNFY